MAKYIHQSKQWPHFTWDKQVVSDGLAKVNKSSGFLMGRLSVIGFDARLSADSEIVSHDVLASSEIEGVLLNPKQVRSSVARKLGLEEPYDVVTSHYVEGVVDMMLDATKNYQQPLTHDRLFSWHNCLFPYGKNGYTKIDVAKYRMGEMKVVSGNFGREKVHYEAIPATRVLDEMNLFLDWFNDSSSEPSYLKSAIAHFWFVCIHPFDDGNGRIGRAIADMALSQADNSSMRYFSMSRQISKDKNSYYRILEHVSRQEDTDITEWLLWYLDCMLRAIDASDEILSRILQKASFWQTHDKVSFSERQNKVMNIYLDGYIGKLTVKNWAKLCKVSVDTAERDIRDLVNKGVLEPQQGRVRDVFYGIRCDENTLCIPGPTEDLEE
ncbi:MAG: Fic family protein [Bacteroidales bacterium]|nr:Fic family protein [Bacteroidales bacterium]